MIEQCSGVLLIVLMSVYSALTETCERTLVMMAEAAGEFLITGLGCGVRMENATSNNGEIV